MVCGPPVALDCGSGGVWFRQIGWGMLFPRGKTPVPRDWAGGLRGAIPKKLFSSPLFPHPPGVAAVFELISPSGRLPQLSNSLFLTTTQGAGFSAVKRGQSTSLFWCGVSHRDRSLGGGRGRFSSFFLPVSIFFPHATKKHPGVFGRKRRGGGFWGNSEFRVLGGGGGAFFCGGFWRWWDHHVGFWGGIWVRMGWGQMVVVEVEGGGGGVPTVGFVLVGVGCHHRWPFSGFPSKTPGQSGERANN